MIIGVCSAKGAPGASTAALATAVVAPGAAVLVEADPAGADGPFRLRNGQGQWLSPEPWLGSLATAARLGVVNPADFAQDTLLGVPVVPGGRRPVDWAPLEGLWGPVADSLSAATGPVVADFGRVTPGHAAARVIATADVLLVVTTTDVAGLAHARDVAARLLETAGLGPDRSAKVMLAPVGEKLTVRTRRVRRDVARIVAAAGLPCPVAGVLPFDAKAAQGLVSGPMTRVLAGSDLIRAAQKMLTSVWRLRPDLAARVATADDTAGPETIGTDDTNGTENTDSTDGTDVQTASRTVPERRGAGVDG